MRWHPRDINDGHCLSRAIPPQFSSPPRHLSFRERACGHRGTEQSDVHCIHKQQDADCESISKRCPEWIQRKELAQTFYFLAMKVGRSRVRKVPPSAWIRVQKETGRAHFPNSLDNRLFSCLRHQSKHGHPSTNQWIQASDQKEHPVKYFNTSATCRAAVVTTIGLMTPTVSQVNVCDGKVSNKQWRHG